MTVSNTVSIFNLPCRVVVLVASLNIFYLSGEITALEIDIYIYIYNNYIYIIYNIYIPSQNIKITRQLYNSIVKVILYSYLILKKMNERIIDS